MVAVNMFGRVLDGVTSEVSRDACCGASVGGSDNGGGAEAMATLVCPEPAGGGDAGVRGGGIRGGTDPVTGGRLGNRDETGSLTMGEGGVRVGKVIGDIIRMKSEPRSVGGDGREGLLRGRTMVTVWRKKITDGWDFVGRWE